MIELTLSFLGSPQIEHDHKRAEISASKALALLAYLAVSGQSHSRDTLSTLFWPDKDQSRARTYLRHALWELKKEVGERRLYVSREQIGFQMDETVWLDVQAFQMGITAVTKHNHPIGHMCPECLAQLNEVVALYRDDFLAGFTLPDSPVFDEWQFFQAEELRQQLTHTLERLVDEYTAQHSYQSAIPYARRWLALEPLHEPVHQSLMRLYALAGQQAAALRQYQECRRLLDAELSIVPTEETVALYEMILSRQFGLGNAGELKQARAEQTVTHITPETDGRTMPPDNTLNTAPFVAREQELARLDELLHATLSGQPRVAFILGEAGQGKTSLLQAFARHAQKMVPNLIVAGGSGNAYTGLGDPYLPFREILARLTGDWEAGSLINTLQPEYAQRIKQLLPQTMLALFETAPDLIDTFVPLAGLRERSAAARLSTESWHQHLPNQIASNPSRPEAELTQTPLLEQYSRWLQAVARHAPLLLILDDLQWADPGSVALLFHLGRRLSGCPIFIVGAYRPDEVAMRQASDPHPLARVVDELQRVFGDIFIDLSQAEGQAFIDAWLDHEPNQLVPFFRQTLFRQTGGHPLFTIELLQAMQDRGDLKQDESGVWQVETNINWNTMPARVEGAIGERIKRLEPSLLELLRVASVEGEEFTAEVVASVLKLDEQQAVRLLSRELDKVHALVRAIGTRRVGERRLSRYRFRHILIQRYLYNSLDDVERSYEHEAVGNALELFYAGYFPEVAVQLAHHFEIAQRPGKTAVYRNMAGDQARHAAALVEAIHHYQSALSHWSEGDKLGQATMMRKLGECQWLTGRVDEALETFEAGYNIFWALENKEEAGAMQRQIGRVYWELGEREKALFHYQRALSILEPLTESVELAWATSSISQMHMLADAYDQAIMWGKRALDLARRLEVTPVIVHALNNVGSSYLSKGEVDKGREMLAESIRLALAENLPHDAGRGRLNLGERLAKRDCYEEARDMFEALYEQASRANTTLYAGSAVIELARIDWLNGRWRAALSRTPLINQWLVEGQSLAYLHVIASTVFSHQYNDLGQPVTAHHMLKSTLSQVRNLDELQLIGPHLAQMIRTLAALQDDTETKKVAQELLAAIFRVGAANHDSLQSLLTLCDALPPSVFAALFDDIVGIYQGLAQHSDYTQIPSQHAALHEIQGMLALFQANNEQAATSFRLAVEQWQMVERPFDQARALKKLGQVLVSIGDDKEAHEAFTQGYAIVQILASQLDDKETKEAFLHSPLMQAIQTGLQK